MQPLRYAATVCCEAMDMAMLSVRTFRPSGWTVFYQGVVSAWGVLEEAGLSVDAAAAVPERYAVAANAGLLPCAASVFLCDIA